jgi:fused signal recognition particle receptor
MWYEGAAMAEQREADETGLLEISAADPEDFSALYAELRGIPGIETLLVYDAATGLNGLSNAQALSQAIGITGIVLTKVDTIGRPLIAAAIQQELAVPVKFLRLAERPVELIPFNPYSYVSALIGTAVR